MTSVLAKLPTELWRTENDGFAAIAEAMDALAVQVDCARVASLPRPSPGGSWPPHPARRRRTG